MEEAYVLSKLESLKKELPHFPDGRIDYTKASYAPLVSVFMQFNGEILLVRRSQNVGNYKGKWNAISGYIDRIEPIRERALIELEEETGIKRATIKEVIRGEPYELNDAEIGKIWLVCPFVVKLRSKPEIRLDMESTECRWIKPEELMNFDTVTGLDKSYAACMKK